MYNLANIYMYDEAYDKIDDVIELLFDSSKQFPHSLNLLCLALVKKYGFNLNEIKNKIAELNEKSPKDKLPRIIDNLYYLGLNCDSNFKILYESYREKYFLYNYKYQIISFSDFHPKTTDENQNKIPNINEIFYEGFGIDI